MFAVEVTKLGKAYGGLFDRKKQIALRGVDLSVEQGSAFGLIGPNGAGKTTFIKALLGVVRPSSGQIRVLGGDPDDPATRARIGYLPERLHLPAAWTPLAFLASVARLKKLTTGVNELERQLERVGLTADSNRRIGGFSKGMKQRLGLAAALLGNPDLLVLDEPTDGVDPLGRADIRKILTQERARGATLFLNSHLLSETERVCDRIGILVGGQLMRSGPLLELCAASTRYRVRFAAESCPEGLEAMGFSKIEQDVFQCYADHPQALNAMLDQARGAGALLVELGRDLKDLEEVLVEVVGAG